jgi:lysyl-tRNA synthetase class 2
MPSSVIRKHYYEPDTRELTVTFVTGRVYLYKDVPADMYAEFCDAPSRGAFFNQHIRDVYPTIEIMPR